MSLKVGDTVKYVEVDGDVLNDYATDVDTDADRNDDGIVEVEQLDQFFGENCKVLEAVCDWLVLIKLPNGRTRYVYDIEIEFVKNKDSHFPNWF